MGTAFPGRVGAIILKAVGVPEPITHVLADYEALALRLAGDPTALAAVKVTLAKNRTVHPLFDTKRFARNLESSFATMWERQQQGLSARSFAVS